MLDFLSKSQYSSSKNFYLSMQLSFFILFVASTLAMPSTSLSACERLVAQTSELVNAVAEYNTLKNAQIPTFIQSNQLELFAQNASPDLCPPRVTLYKLKNRQPELVPLSENARVLRTAWFDVFNKASKRLDQYYKDNKDGVLDNHSVHHVVLDAADPIGLSIEYLDEAISAEMRRVEV